MLQQLIEFCTSSTSLYWIALGSDFAIALAYFAIPITMAVVFRHHKEDIPYPWLWTLFVVFIVACGLTHLGHLWAAITGRDYTELHAAIGLVTALASVGTAIAFAWILPQIKTLPSPRQQRTLLEKTVAQRTHEKDLLIREINHRIGNQLQILSSVISIERRRAKDTESVDILRRLQGELDKMAAQHVELSRRDYHATMGDSGPDHAAAAKAG